MQGIWGRVYGKATLRKHYNEKVLNGSTVKRVRVRACRKPREQGVKEKKILQLDIVDTEVEIAVVAALKAGGADEKIGAAPSSGVEKAVQGILNRLGKK